MDTTLGFYKNKRVLVTGHTGFKGGWLTLFLSELGALVKGIALPPNTTQDFFVVNSLDKVCDSQICNICDYVSVEKIVIDFQPDVIFHLAAQPLVRISYKSPIETYQTNVIGTANILQALRFLNKRCSVVIITTDKVYENKEWYYPYRETDRLGGKDPYSASKACAELVVNSFRQSFFYPNHDDLFLKAIVTARAGNVIGGGDWSADRLLPDVVRAIQNDEDVVIRNPLSVRPWQHVLEPVYGYLLLAGKLYNNPSKYTGEWNFGPYSEDVLNVEEVVKIAIEILGRGKYRFEKLRTDPDEAKLLKLDISKSLNVLKWKPRLKTREAIEWTIDWYNVVNDSSVSTLSFSKKLINDYLNLIGY